MQMDSGRPTAKILAFPTGGRAGVAKRGKQLHSAANASVAPDTSNVISDSWYHEAAVREAERS